VIAPLQSKFYEKLAREENNAILRQPNAFDIYYLDKVKHFLPADLQFVSKDPENYILRQEFIQREEFSDMNKKIFR
jgi:predicted component of type VI protein secretion system